MNEGIVRERRVVARVCGYGNQKPRGAFLGHGLPQHRVYLASKAFSNG